MAVSLYRKYRPQVFSDVVGQQHIERTLVNAVREGNVASAYLFCGPRGTGKTTTARLLAKALLCEAGPNSEPDGTCEQCQAIAAGTHPDVYELDAASHTGVDNVREEIIGRVHFAPTRGRCKVYIIDEVHMLSKGAFNALLKTLEEPPEHVVFILCTTEPNKVLETIRSRCQRFDFKRLSNAEIVSYLERICKGEGFIYEPEALEYLATRASGGMRDATTALEQAAVSTQGQLTLENVDRVFGKLGFDTLLSFGDAIARCDTAASFELLDSLVSDGTDLRQFSHELARHFRNLYVMALTDGQQGIVEGTQDQLEAYRAQSQAFGNVERLSRALSTCGALMRTLVNTTDARLDVEIALTKLCRPQSELTLEALEERIAALEAGTPAGRPQRSAPEQAAPVSVASAQSAPAPRANAQTQAPAAEVAPTTEQLRHAQEPAPEQVHPTADDAPAYNTQPAHQDMTSEQEQPASANSTESARTASQKKQQAGAGMSPARLLAAVLTVVRREDVATGALLSGVTLQEENGQFFLSFPEGTEFAMKVASSGDARALIERAFAEALGHQVRVEFRKDTRANAQRAMERDMGTAPEPEPEYDAYAQDEPPAYDDPSAFSSDDEADYYAASLARDYGMEPPQPDNSVDISSDETAANIADTLSVFGNGIKLQELDSNEEE
ncbi:MAG: DNA polymerase III subunit gamma/tau [Coriobacteriales bacterium]|jgi:DNA polymerase-3 subunit gamma/tau